VAASHTTYRVHSKWVVDVGVAAIVIVVVAVGITTTIRTFRSKLLRHLLLVK
jgi:hypothetical protein